MAVADVLFSGNNRYVVRVTEQGNDDAAVAIVDRSSLTGPDGVNPPSKLVVEEIDWVVAGYDFVTLLWDNATDENLAQLQGDSFRSYKAAGGLVSSVTPTDLTNTQGDILLTTGGVAAPTDAYDIMITVRLKE